VWINTKKQLRGTTRCNAAQGWRQQPFRNPTALEKSEPVMNICDVPTLPLKHIISTLHGDIPQPRRQWQGQPPTSHTLRVRGRHRPAPIAVVLVPLIIRCGPALTDQLAVLTDLAGRQVFRVWRLLLLTHEVPTA